ncbi:brain protein 44-like protein [Babesia caballi]|uniref:Brain protein 44-like protein n=1 Tax=Babesia caballi TaxID=5871 RepID=A0AAV4LU38_BABCB|nr:brain protein 44-like protein [Babesia caballi]
MWRAHAAALAALCIAAVDAKEIHQSQKVSRQAPALLLEGRPALHAQTKKAPTHFTQAILHPRPEGLTTISRGAESPGLQQKEHVNIAAAPLVRRIQTKKAAERGQNRDVSTHQSGEGGSTRGVYSEVGGRQAGSQVFSLGASTDGARSGGEPDSATGTVGGTNGDVGPSLWSADATVGAPLKITGFDGPVAMLDPSRTTAKAASGAVARRENTAVVRRIGAMRPYCSIVPRPNVFGILGNLLASLRLLMLDQSQQPSGHSLALVTMTTLSAIPLVITHAAKSSCAMDFLRKRWAFQGECGSFSVEQVLTTMMHIMAAESALKLALRFWFYGRSMQLPCAVPGCVRSLARVLSQFVAFVPRTFNLLGAAVFGGYWHKDVGRSFAHALVHGAVLARMAIFTAAQHAFFTENYHTAAFILSPGLSWVASAVTGALCTASSAASLVTMFVFKNFANAVDVEHLIDSAGFRATESQAAAVGYIRNALHHVPKWFKPANLDLVLQLSYYHDYLTRLMPRGIEWPVLLLHFTLALNANSAAGLYLAVVNLLYAVVNQRLSNYERSILTHDIEEIVEESR